MHKTRKTELHKRKVPLKGSIPCSSKPNTTNTAPEIHLSKSDATKKEIVHKYHHRSDHKS
jgi:hypothetical protein